MSFDNANANTTSVDMLKRVCRPILWWKKKSYSTICHVLNLCVQVALNMLQNEIGQNSTFSLILLSTIKKYGVDFVRQMSCVQK